MKKICLIWLFFLFLISSSTMLNAQIVYKYSYIPKIVYENQLFPITVMAIGDRGVNKSYFTFDDESNRSRLLSEKPLITRNGNNSFYTFYFKALNSDIKIPRLFISSVDRETSLNAYFILVRTLSYKQNFSHVLSSQMKIKSSQVSHFDESHHIITLSIEAYEANLEDIFLDEVYESGIENLIRKDAKVEGDFFVVVPISQKELKFTYFNTIKNQFISFKSAIKVTDASVTTQSNLNPKDDGVEKVKRYTLVFIFILFLTMSILKKDLFYLILAIISFTTFLTLQIPNKEICIKEGSALYVLPTHTSTISTIIDEESTTTLLYKYKEFNKIEYNNRVIGWIKNENICNN